jgi:4-hydroxybenzoate polyprenyltransferase
MNLKTHIWTLPRWFASPFFLVACGLGVVLAGGSFTALNTWLILLAVLFAMAGGHSLNSFLDYAWTGLDKGEKEDRSAEKSYTGGQNLIENGKVSLEGIIINVACWWVLSGILLFVLGYRIGNDHTWWVLFGLWVAGMIVPFWYSQAKFHWLHELSLGIGCGPLPLLLGMFAVNNNPHIVTGLLVSIIPAVVLSFAGLAIDEFPDAEANLKKGVKSIAYKVWEYSEWTLSPDQKGEAQWSKSYSLLQWYLTTWLLMLFGFQIFLQPIQHDRTRRSPKNC